MQHCVRRKRKLKYSTLYNGKTESYSVKTRKDLFEVPENAFKIALIKSCLNVKTNIYDFFLFFIYCIYLMTGITATTEIEQNLF